MVNLRLENMTQDELVKVVMRSGAIPDERILAGIRIERLECEAVRIRENVQRAIKTMLLCRPRKSGFIAAQVAWSTGCAEFERVMNEVSVLTERYFGEDK